MQRLIFGAAGLGIIIILGVTAIIFFSARSSLAEELDNAERALLVEDDIAAVNNVSYFFGNEAVYTAETINTEGEAEWVFYQDGEIRERVLKQDSLDRSQVENVVKERFELQKIRNVKPGYENGEPVYEATFEKDGRLHFYYMKLRNGEFIKRYSMKQS
ncbi:hypothetical protein [Alteribacillus bidgolensis]|uniref:Uncharacterized protein YpmB n=1 Tax=Alteribacillus bidgolensis TaxID=930129 RepID=A0A1G8C9G0_9BACI|nr:hypothetical protein [Alteribacillus bidgolensis]SDH42028.1 Uncharacterized protein YpmB [Alteribacillus bidgolensis]